MVDLSVIRDLVAIFSFLVGLTYYIMNLRNQEKNQKQTEETRKIQLLNEINNEVIEHASLRWNELMNLEWKDYQDFMSKYGYGNDPDLYQKRMAMWRNLNRNGLLIRDGLIDVSSYFDYIGDLPTVAWDKFKPIIVEQRVLFDNPLYFSGFEYLAKEINSYRFSLGLKPKEYIDTR